MFFVFASILCTASGKELLNRSFQTEESLKDITFKFPGNHALVTREDETKALEIRIRETVKNRRNALVWRGKGMDFQNRDVRFSVELCVDLKAPLKNGTETSSPSEETVRTGNPEMGIYFCEDPDGYWCEIVPSK